MRLLQMPMRSEAEPLILYYAFGGGLGHVTRAAAVLRRLQRQEGANVLAFCNTPQPLPLQHEGIPFRSFAGLSLDDLRREVPPAIRALTPRMLVVDVFPGGIAGELVDLLPQLPCRKVLVYRHLKDAEAAGLFRLLPHYDAVLLAEDPPAPLPCPAHPCRPILLRDAEELLPREMVRLRLGTAGNEPVILAVSSGDREWTRDLFRLLERITARLPEKPALRLAAPFATEASMVTHYPALELVNGVDLVIGPGGYNLFHEAQATGVPSIFLPQEKRFDDQHWRTRSARTAGSPEELAQAIREALRRLQEHPRQPAVYVNGAETAAAAILTVLRG